MWRKAQLTTPETLSTPFQNIIAISAFKVMHTGTVPTLGFIILNLIKSEIAMDVFRHSYSGRRRKDRTIYHGQIYSKPDAVSSDSNP